MTHLREKGDRMPNTKNTSQLELIKEKLGKAKSVVLTNYSGLTVNEQNKLRSELTAAGGEYVVAKNTLFKIALDKEELNSDLEGQTAVLFSYEDEVNPLKKLFEFIKKLEKPEVKKGLMNDKVLSKEEVIELSKLPGKDQLIATVISRLQGPSYGLVNVLNAGIRNLVYAVEAIRKQKEAKA